MLSQLQRTDILRFKKEHFFCISAIFRDEESLLVFKNLIQKVFSYDSKSLGFASSLKPSCRAGKCTYRTLM
jgi:hypothetical protein